MFVDELTEMNMELQKTIDTCSNKDNITMVLTEDVEQFRQLVNVLDPSKIDFTKGGYFNNMKIEAYWGKLADLSPSLQTSISRIKNHGTVVSNTLTVLQKQLKQASETSQRIKSEYEGFEADESLMAQFIVTDTYISVIENLITEYTIWQDRIKRIITTSAAALKQTIAFARIDRRFGGYDTVTYKSNYADMQSACSEFVSTRNR
ncbi:MAG: hypothetical protein J1F11_03315 [Oscillospiraceae bacterium]|nr:hypothetical protein [Oscillospiraceae bacterium]